MTSVNWQQQGLRPTIQLGMLEAAQQIQQRVNAYDQAAKLPKMDSFNNKEDSFTHHWAMSSSRWAARNGIAQFIDGQVGLTPSKPLYNPFLKKALTILEPNTKNAISYYELLKIKNFKLEKLPEESWRLFLINQENQKTIFETIQDNFSEIKNIKIKLSPWNYIKNTLYSQNIKNLIEPLKEGKISTTFLRLGGYLLSAGDVVYQTCKFYQKAKAKENGTLASKLKTLFTTAHHFMGYAIRNAICWEAGTLGFIIGTSLVCVGSVPTLIAGWLFGGLFSTLTYKTINKIKDSKLI